MPHDYTWPTDYIQPHTTQRAGIIDDAAVVNGKIKILLEYVGQPFSDTFTSADTGSANIMRYLEHGRYRWDSASPVYPGILNGRAFMRANTAIISPDMLRSSPDVAVDVTGSGTGGIVLQAALGYQIRFGANFTTGKAFAQSLVSGTATSYWVGGTIAAGATHRLRVVTNKANSSFAFYIDGVLQTQFVDSFLYPANGSGWRFGLWAIPASSSNNPNSTSVSAATLFDNFYVAAENAPAATSWHVINIDGDTVASGPVTGLTGIIEFDDSALKHRGRGPYGWYRFRLFGPERNDGKYRASYGDCNIVRIPTRSGFASNPERRLTTSLTDVTGDGWEPITRSVFGVGPTRLDVVVTSSDVVTPNAESLTQAQYLDANYVAYAKPSRPRAIIGHFAAGSGGNDSRITQVVANFKDYIHHWEPRNEPDLNTSASDWVTEQQAFYNAVKAGDATAKVLGPNTVSFATSSRTWIDSFLALGGGNYVDELSVHAYNTINGSIASARQTIADLQAVLAARNFTKPVWQTEQGADTCFGDIYQPRNATRWWVLKVMCAEIMGLCPIERYVSWYDIEHGYNSVQHYALSGSGCEAPFPMLRVAIDEIGDRTLSGQLQFGAADCMYLGGIWSGNDGSKTVMIMAESDATQPVRFRLAGASSVTVSDCWGNLSTIAASGKVVAVSPVEFPTWIRVPAGVTLTQIETDWQFGPQITVASPTTTSTNFYGANLLADGIKQDTYTLGSLWSAELTGKFPFSMTFPLNRATVDRVILYGVYNINEFTSITDFDMDYSTDGGTTWVRAYAQRKAEMRSHVFTADRLGLGSLGESYWTGRSCWDMRLPNGPIAGLTHLRLTVNDVSYGMWERPEFVTTVWGQDGKLPYWRNTRIRDVVILGPPTTRPLTTQEKRRQRRRLSFRFR